MYEQMDSIRLNSPVLKNRESTLLEDLKAIDYSCDSNQNLSFVDLSNLEEASPQEQINFENKTIMNSLLTKLNQPKLQLSKLKDFN